MNTKTLALTLGAVTIAAVSAIAAVGSGYTLFGGATYVMPGNASNRAVQLVANVSNTNPSDDYSGKVDPFVKTIFSLQFANVRRV